MISYSAPNHAPHHPSSVCWYHATELRLVVGDHRFSALGGNEAIGENASLVMLGLMFSY